MSIVPKKAARPPKRPSDGPGSSGAGDKVVVTTRVSEGVLAGLERLAKAQSTTIAAVQRQVLEDYVSAREQTRPDPVVTLASLDQKLDVLLAAAAKEQAERLRLQITVGHLATALGLKTEPTTSKPAK